MTESGRPIDFRAHEVRAGEAGAIEDFQQMLALLVHATEGGARIVRPAQGDWGIDVFTGDLNGRVTVWQAKYRVSYFSPAARRTIQDAFMSALRAAQHHGYVIDRWVLCAPVSIGFADDAWWRRWQAEAQGQSGVTIELWDEETLRHLLQQPGAADVRRHYYESDERLITFRVHELRAGDAGATDDFTQMLALLIQATDAATHSALSEADASGLLTSDVAGQMTAWQARYVLKPFGRVLHGIIQDRIRAQFDAAVKAAAAAGSSLTRWLLCVPGNLDPRTHVWWSQWVTKTTAESGVAIDLWDETTLRTLLLRPDSADIRRHYFEATTPIRPSATTQNGATTHLQVLDVWSAVDQVASRSRPRDHYITWLAQMTAVDAADVRFARDVRNSIAHDGHRSVTPVDAGRALDIALHVLIRLSRRATVVINPGTP